MSSTNEIVEIWNVGSGQFESIVEPYHSYFIANLHKFILVGVTMCLFLIMVGVMCTDRSPRYRCRERIPLVDRRLHHNL